MEFKNHPPIYLQIADSIRDSIMEGVFKEGAKLDSVRELASKIKVNPNTVMRAYSHLQSLEIISNKRGVGFFVTDDASQKIKKELRENFLKNELPEIIQKMHKLDIDIAEVEHLFLKAKIRS
ncbi:MAG: GntR family transcriptional regulator [Bacteroidota bacterium]